MRLFENSLKQIVDELCRVVDGGFNQTFYIGDTSGVFRSHFDWHSSVHAHWMLLSSSRVTQDEILNAKIRGRLSQLVLDEEREKLRSQPGFELPYGQAWLLLLLCELEKYGEVDVIAFKEETLQRLITWLEKTDFPELTKNSYHSWLFTHFMVKTCGLTSLDAKFNSVESVSDENDPKDFFSSESLFNLLKNRPNQQEDWIGQLNAVLPVVSENCHAVGKIISKSWAKPAIQKDALENSVVFVGQVLREPQLWRDDFKTVSHWVPQFLWFGIWLGLGEP